jgi:ABC-type antimicrobial peptide transport system permease subunit
MIAIAHALFMTVRYRRHELAVLRALGFARRQVRATIAWEATTMTVVGLLIGIPLGILVGRVVWNAVAHGLGIAATPDLGALTLLLVVVGALVCVNLLALGASAFATRIKPGPALAVE